MIYPIVMDDMPCGTDIKCVSRCPTDKVQTLVVPAILRHVHRGLHFRAPRFALSAHRLELYNGRHRETHFRCDSVLEVTAATTVAAVKEGEGG